MIPITGPTTPGRTTAPLAPTVAGWRQDLLVEDQMGKRRGRRSAMFLHLIHAPRKANPLAHVLGRYTVPASNLLERSSRLTALRDNPSLAFLRQTSAATQTGPRRLNARGLAPSHTGLVPARKSRLAIALPPSNQRRKSAP